VTLAFLFLPGMRSIERGPLGGVSPEPGSTGYGSALGPLLPPVPEPGRPAKTRLETT
jgi:hypothetical protein